MKKCLAVLAGLALASSMAMGADLSANPDYKAKCAGCHGANGEGKPAMKTAPLKEAAAKSDAELTTAITKGVDAKPVKMPGFDGKLTPEQIKTLVADIKSLK